MIRNDTTDTILAYQINICDTFWKRGRGLMFKRTIEEDEALIFCYDKPSIPATTIHMFFVFFDIAVIWLDADRRVVDAQRAKPFRPYYAPRQPAQYFIECHPQTLQWVKVGDQLSWNQS